MIKVEASTMTSPLHVGLHLSVFLCVVCSTAHGQDFTKITEGDIVNDVNDSQGGSWGDYDLDGYPDLFVTNGFLSETTNNLYHNNGDGSFTKITSGPIVSDLGQSRSSTWGDYNNDGLVDLFVAVRANVNFLYMNNSDGEFTKIISGHIANTFSYSYGCSWADYDNDGRLDLFVSNIDIPPNNFLYHNNGDGTFTSIQNGAIVGEYSGHTSNWVDYDHDGDLDVFVSGLRGYNFLYRNDGQGDFTKITDNVIVWGAGGSNKTSSWGDYDNDGDFDLFIGTIDGTEPNFLFSNDGEGSFDEVYDPAISSELAECFGSSWGDYDNDGDLDLFVTVANLQEGNRLYANNGNGSFTRIVEGIVVSDTGISTGASWCDYDNDGDLDLFVANFGVNFLYTNDGNPNAWIEVTCIGSISNLSGIGSKVRAKATINGTAVWQLREISTQTGWASQNDLRAHFGFGDAVTIDSITIEWPSGIVQSLSNIAPNQHLRVVEDSSLASSVDQEDILPEQFALHQNYPNPFNPSTTIRFGMGDVGYVSLKVYDLLGREVATLVNERLGPGSYTRQWDSGGLSGGVYFYRLSTAKFSQTKRLVILR